MVELVSPKIDEIEGIEANPRKSIPSHREKIRRIQATITSANFFVYVIAGSNGIERVAVLPIGLVWKAALRYYDSAFPAYFSKFLALSVGFPFSNACETQKSELILRIFFEPAKGLHSNESGNVAL